MLFLLLWLASWLWLGGYIHRGLQFVEKSYYALTIKGGLSVEDVLVEGRKNTDLAAIHAIINIAPGDPILSFKPDQAKAQLEKISWVKTARVERRLPSHIFISIQERKPAALWKDSNGLALIDMEGVILTRQKPRSYGRYVTFYGEKANERAKEVLALLEAQPELKEHITEAAIIGERRWDLITEKGIRIQCPENDLPLAISTLAKAQEKQQLFSRNIRIIDLRQQGRIIMQTDRGQAEDLK